MTCNRPGVCNCDTCTELRLTPQDLFELLEDERAEFEATFKDMHYDVTRFDGSTKAEDDYVSSLTSNAWVGWLLCSGEKWVPKP